MKMKWNRLFIALMAGSVLLACTNEKEVQTEEVEEAIVLENALTDE